MNTPHTALGRYRIDGALGSGGMATVYRGYDSELHRPVAVKLLSESLADDHAFRTRFLREARTAARLDHPNIVRVFDIGQDDDGRPFIVMEYVAGETLADIIGRERRLGLTRVVAVGADCSAALAYAHRAGVIHRDVKPRNLLAGTDGSIKLADFGVARAPDQTHLTQAGSIIGTAQYLAPEQAAGKRVDASADIYSFGVVLYESLTGRPPYDGSSLTAIALAQREQQAAPIGTLRTDIPAWLATVVHRCLAPAAADRPSAESLTRAFADSDARTQVIVQPSTTHASTPPEARLITRAPTHVTRPAAPRRRPRRRPIERRWIVLVVLLLAAIGVALVLSTRNANAPAPSVPATPTGHTPAQHAQNLARWIHDHTA